MIKAEVVADSLNQYGDRLTTLLVVMPRYILAEFNTHRMLSKNSASSRAIPFEKNLKNIEENPFVPIAWQKDHKGMQGTEYFPEGFTAEEGIGRQWIDAQWLVARNRAVEVAKAMSNNNVTKQLVNRLLEPFMWHTVLVSGTEWENFFALRCPQYFERNDPDKTFRSWKDLVHDAFERGANRDVVDQAEATDILTRLKSNKGQADIHMMLTAEAIWDAKNKSKPKELKEGEWHVPFGDQIILDERELTDYLVTHPIFEAKSACGPMDMFDYARLCIAVARCARVSYTVVGEEGKPYDFKKDIELHDRLSSSGHWSPFEHVARAMNDNEYGQHVQGRLKVDSEDKMKYRGWSGNFKGFIQYRKTFENENITV